MLNSRDGSFSRILRFAVQRDGEVAGVVLGRLGSSLLHLECVGVYGLEVSRSYGYGNSGITLLSRAACDGAVDV